MEEPIKDTTINFSPIEIGLIKEYSDIHKGELLITDDNIIMKSEIIRSSFKVRRNNENRRIIKICHIVFDNYDVYDCLYPSDLKKNLGL